MANGANPRDIKNMALNRLRKKGEEYNDELRNIQANQSKSEESTAVLFAFLKSMTNTFKEPIYEKLLEKNKIAVAELEEETKAVIDKISDEYKQGKALNRQSLKDLKMQDKHIDSLIDFSQALDSETMLASVIEKVTQNKEEKEEKKEDNKEDNKEFDVHRNKSTHNNTSKNGQRQRQR